MGSPIKVRKQVFFFLLFHYYSGWVGGWLAGQVEELKISLTQFNFDWNCHEFGKIKIHNNKQNKLSLHLFRTIILHHIFSDILYVCKSTLLLQTQIKHIISFKLLQKYNFLTHYIGFSPNKDKRYLKEANVSIIPFRNIFTGKR